MNDLRTGLFDVLVGVNLLREGLDLPEVSLVAILDADKEGFLRSHRSLTQTVGRAARNVNGTVIMYADSITDSMQKTIDETARRRCIQLKYNEEHHIQPRQVVKEIRETLPAPDNNRQAPTVQIPTKERPNHTNAGHYRPYTEQSVETIAAEPTAEYLNKSEIEKQIEETTRKMKESAKSLDFIQAAQYRDEIERLQNLLNNK